MNELRQETRDVLRQMLAAGASTRAIRRELGISTNTVSRYSRIWKLDAKCGCTKKAGHNGWCSYRYLLSLARQAWMEAHGWRYRTHVGRPHVFRPPKVARERSPIVARRPVGRQANPYRFKPLPPATDPLLLAIRRCVPPQLGKDVRDDVCQDIAVAVLSGDITEAQIPEIVNEYVKAVFKQTPWRELSLESRHGNDPDRQTLGDRLGIS